MYLSSPWHHFTHFWHNMGWKQALSYIFFKLRLVWHVSWLHMTARWTKELRTLTTLMVWTTPQSAEVKYLWFLASLSKLTKPFWQAAKHYLRLNTSRPYTKISLSTANRCKLFIHQLCDLNHHLCFHSIKSITFWISLKHERSHLWVTVLLLVYIFMEQVPCIQIHWYQREEMLYARIHLKTNFHLQSLGRYTHNDQKH